MIDLPEHLSRETFNMQNSIAVCIALSDHIFKYTYNCKTHPLQGRAVGDLGDKSPTQLRVGEDFVPLRLSVTLSEGGNLKLLALHGAFLGKV